MSSKLLGQNDFEKIDKFLKDIGVRLDGLDPCTVILQTEHAKEVWFSPPVPVLIRPFDISSRHEVSISYHDDNSLRLTLILYVNFRDQIVTKTLRAYWFGDNLAPEVKIF